MTEDRARGRRPSGAALALALPVALVLLFAVDSGVAAWQGWRPGRSRIELLVLAILGGLAVAVALGALFGPARRWLDARAPALLAVQLSLLAAVLVSEAALGLLGDRVTRTPFHRHPRGLAEVFTPKIPGTSPRARFSVSSLGLRGPEAPADRRVYRILAVGGSTTEDVYLDDDATWTHLLMTELNAAGSRRFWVGSAGRSGFASVEHLAFLERSELLDDVDAVFMLVGINDLARAVWGEPADRVFQPPSPLWSRLRLVELVKLAASTWVSPGNLVMDRNALFVHDAQASRHEAQVVDGTIPLAPYLAAYRQRLEAIVAACRRRGVVLVLADQPTVFRAAMSADEERRLWFLRRSDGTYLPPRKMRQLMDRFNDVTRDTARRLGAQVVRLSVLDGRQSLFYDDCHFSETGAREVAARIAEGVPWQTLPYRQAH